MKYKIKDYINMFKSKKRLAIQNTNYQSRAIREIDLLLENKDKSDMIIDLQKQVNRLSSELNKSNEYIEDLENEKEYYQNLILTSKTITQLKKKYVKDLKEID